MKQAASGCALQAEDDVCAPTRPLHLASVEAHGHASPSTTHPQDAAAGAFDAGSEDFRFASLGPAALVSESRVESLSDWEIGAGSSG